MQGQVKRLIEADLPISQIGQHARAEKDLRSGHPWHLHIWWARRPWGACRAVELASLLPDPTDPNCPADFISAATKILAPLGYRIQGESREELQRLLFRFIGDFANWELGANSPHRSAARSLIRAAFQGERPVLLDSFAGNGAIPGEALRLGCTSIAVELNPVATLILRTLLEAVPRHGDALLKHFEEGARFIQSEAAKLLGPFYPKKQGKIPIAWLWARTVVCEGPGCGAVVPLISQPVIGKGRRKVWIEITPNKAKKSVTLAIAKGSALPKNLKRTAGGGSATCPVCEYTTPKESVKKQGKQGRMGHRLYGVAVALGERQGKEYFDASAEDQKAFDLASDRFRALISSGRATEITEPFVLTYGLHVPPHYGISTWGDLFSDRQKLALYTIADILHEYTAVLKKVGTEPSLLRDTITTLGLALSNSVHYWTNASTWLSEGMISCFITGNAIAMRWDYAEANPLVPTYAGGLEFAFRKAREAIAAAQGLGDSAASVLQGNAANLPWPDDSVDMYFVDPPYYDSVPYADLSDVCYVWLKRFLSDQHPDLFCTDLTPKAEQIVVNPYTPQDGRGAQTFATYQERMTRAFGEGRRVLKPDGIGAVVFAHKGTDAWEALVGSIIDSGFMVTASWPIDTERGSRMRANKSAALGSSVHIILRPRKPGITGDWRDVLSELPKRIHEWMPRLRKENIVGADAIFACLGPALEIFSRYDTVERASGETVTLKEYLEHVWAAVSKEALAMIFEGADATGFEEDSRLTAMWLWTLSTGINGSSSAGQEPLDEEQDDDSSSRTKLTGFALEYDAARKIAQGLGAHLEALSSLVEIKADTARLLPVAERVRALFAKDEVAARGSKRKKKASQLKFSFEAELEEAEQDAGWGKNGAPKTGETVLDRLHQTMILFGAGRTEAVRRFLVDEGVGREERFWKLADALAALYPPATDERRWVQGVIARKKGLGL